MKDNKDKPKAELIEELKSLREEQKEKVILENKLRESENRFKILFEYAPDGYYVSDLEGTFIDGNKAAERITGYRKKELIGKNYFLSGMLSSTGDMLKAREVLKRNKKGLPTGPEEFILQRKDKKSVEVEISTYPVKINGRMFALGIVRDISKRKHLERALKHSEKEKLAILDIAPDMVIYQNMAHEIIWANKTVCDSVKKKMEELKGRKCYQVWAGRETPCEGCPVEKSWETGKMTRGEINTPDGRYWMLAGIPVTDDSGKTIGAVESGLNITELRQSQEKLQKTMDAIIETIAKISETRDPYTAGHQQKVSQLATSIAQEMKLPQDKIEGIKIVSLVHDIGKIGLPAEILSKPSKLTETEYSLIKNHSQIGYDILKSIEFPWPVAQIVLQHHERLDGSGYPNNLKGDKILLEAKIIGVADTVEAMSSHRPYRAALGIDKALEEISQNRGILYDPEVVDACIKIFKKESFKF